MSQTHAAPRSPIDLADHNCLLYAYSIYGPEFHLVDRAGNFPFTDPAGNRLAGRVAGNLITTSIDVLRQAAAGGLGLWLCPPLLVSDLLVSGALVRLLPDYAGPDMEIVALYPHRRQLSAKVRLFLDLLSHRFAQEQGRLDAVSEREGPE